MLTFPWKCTVLHCNHLGNTWKPLVLMTRHFDYCLSASEGDNQSVRSSAPVVSRCFPGGYNVKLYISRGRLARWLLAFLHSAIASSGTLSFWFTRSRSTCKCFFLLFISGKSQFTYEFVEITAIICHSIPIMVYIMPMGHTGKDRFIVSQSHK